MLLTASEIIVAVCLTTISLKFWLSLGSTFTRCVFLFLLARMILQDSLLFALSGVAFARRIFRILATFFLFFRILNTIEGCID